MGVNEVNTTAYHPQTDGLIERFNHTLTSMLAKTVKQNGSDWGKHLSYVLYVYRTSPQESTKEPPFFLLYGRDSRLPTDQALSPKPPRDIIDVDTYKSEVSQGLSAAWKLTREQVQKAQRRQKTRHDRHARDPGFHVGDRVFVLMPAK